MSIEELTTVASYLMEHYYDVYFGVKDKPSMSDVIRAIDLQQDKVLVIRDGSDICGVAVFLTLSDDSFSALCNGDYDVTDIEDLEFLLRDDGCNIHFILLSAKDLKTILKGVRRIKKDRHPKTISWWNPSMTKLHRYTLN